MLKDGEHSQSVTSIMLWRKREGRVMRMIKETIIYMLMYLCTWTQIIIKSLKTCTSFMGLQKHHFSIFLKQTGGPVKLRNLSSHIILLLHLIYMKWSYSEPMCCKMIKKQLQKSTCLILQSKNGRWAVETIRVQFLCLTGSWTLGGEMSHQCRETEDGEMSKC